MNSRSLQRGYTGRSYGELSMHAAGGVHEYALAIVQRTVESGSTVLDIGAGSGALTARLASAGYQVTATDIDLSDYGGQAPAVTWDAAGVGLPPELSGARFDAVCAVETLEHVENPIQALRNMRELLAPEGVLVVSTPHLAHPRSRLKFLVTGTPSYFGRAEYLSPGHRTLLPDWLLLLHVRTAGFREVRVSYAGQLGLKGRQRLFYAALRPLFAGAGMLPHPRVDDGCVTFVVARR